MSDAPSPPAAGKPPEPAVLVSCTHPGLAYPVVTGDGAAFAGWALAPSGVARVEAVPATGSPVALQFGADAPAVDLSARYLAYPDAARCGYEGRVPTADLPDGPQHVVLRVTGHDGEQAELPVPIEIDRDALATGRLIAFVDRPLPGSPAVVGEGSLGLRGWALSTAGVVAVEAVIGGEVRGALRLGMLRPDVPRVYPEFPQVEHCGFVGVVPVSDVPPGNHVVTIRVRGGNGEQIEIDRPFVVVPSTTIFGRAPRANAQYARWLDLNEPTPDDLAAARAAADAMTDGPRLALLMPLRADSPDPSATVSSLRQQVYGRWELHLLAAHGAEIREVDPGDAAIVVHRAREGDRLSDLANTLLESGTHDVVAVLDPGDRLSPLATLRVAEAFASDPRAEMVYVDHDAWSGPNGIRWDPCFKPDWAPDLHLSTDYVGGFAPSRVAAARRVGGFTGDLDPADRYDLALRLTDGVGADDPRVRHLPRLLHSRLAVPPQPGVAAASGRPAPDPFADAAVARALARRGTDAVVEPGLVPGTRRIRHALRATPPVTIVIPSGGKMHYLRPCLESVLGTSTYPALNVVVVDNSPGTDVEGLCRELAANGAAIRREPFALQPFNFSAVVNHALPLVEDPYLVLMNDDMTVVTPDWVEAMLEHAQRPEIGAVGARLLYPDRTIQHAGVVFGPYGGSTHPFRHLPEGHPGYFDFPHVVREWSAVTFACAMLRRSVVEEAGPLDEVAFRVAFNDADLCLRIRERGYRIVSTPHAVLYHYESATKVLLAEPGEVAQMRERWGRVINDDPFYNPNLTRAAEDYSLNLERLRD